jgi:hypothetical protein
MVGRCCYKQHHRYTGVKKGPAPLKRPDPMVNHLRGDGDMSRVADPRPEAASEVEIVVEALGVLQTRDGFEIPPELIEERARNVIASLRSSHAMVRVGSTGLGQVLAHLDAASTILVRLEGSAG